MWKDLFTLNQVERRGTWLLAALMLVTFLINAFYPLYLRSDEVVNQGNSLELKALAELILSHEKPSEPASSMMEDVRLPSRPFDPNNVDPERHHEYGLSRAQATTLFRYTSAGGKFRKPEDLARMRNLREDDLERIRPYLVFPDKKHEKREHPGKPLPVKIQDLNQADTNLLMALPGIGKVLANRIIKFREALGGFHNREQIRDVYGMPEETANRILPYIEVDSSSLRKLDLQADSFKVLVRHPYLDVDRVKMIMRLRRTNPGLLHPDSIGPALGLPPERMGMIKPYIR